MKNHHKGNPIHQPVAPQQAPDREEVARRAYQIWETEGQPSGRHDSHWLEAEKQLAASDQSYREPEPDGS